MEAGFLNIVEIGQYFITKDTEEFSQFQTVACREYTLPREEGASQLKGWIQGNTKIEPVLEVVTSNLHGKFGVEIRIWSVNRDDTHSWVRLSHGSNQFVMNLNNNEQEIPEGQLEEYAIKLDASALHADQSLRKTTKKRTCRLLQEQFLLGRELGLMLNQGNVHSPMMKYLRKWCIFFVIHNMCIEKMEPFNSGELQKIFRNISCLAFLGQMVGGKHAWQEEEKHEKIPVQFQYCTDSSGTIVYFRALHGHSGRNFMHPSVDNLIIQSNFFQYIVHVGCAKSIYILSSVLEWIPWTKITRILMWSTWMFRVVHNNCIKNGKDIKTQYIGNTSILLLRKCWNSIKLDRMPSSWKKNFQLIVLRKLSGWKLEKSYTKRIHVNTASNKDLLETRNGKVNWVQNMLNDQKLDNC